jgi:PAS domain S-box-containing protein
MSSELGVEQIAGLGFEQIVRTAPVAIAVIDASGRFIFSNPRARELARRQLGVEMPADLGSAVEIFHPNGRRYERRDWPVTRSLTTGEEILDEEFFYALPDGDRLPVRCSSSPVRDEDGQIVAVVVALTDVTEQKRHEERLKYLAGLLDNCEDAVIAMDDRFHLTVWNKGAERLYGWKPEEVVGHFVDVIALTNLSEAQRIELRQELATSGRWRGDASIARKDGATVEIELVSVALRGERGETTGYLSIHRDISERKRAEETLRAAERQSATILESITDAFVAVDSDWRYTYVNDLALARMRDRKGVQLEREEVIGRGMWELLPELMGTELERRYRDVMRDRRPDAFESYFEFSGEWIEARVYPTEDGIAIYYRDVSARRRIEEALREAQEQRALASRRLHDVRESERSRIARDLHDEAIQTLTYAVARAAAASADDAAAQLSSLLAELPRVLEQLRGAVFDLALGARDLRPFDELLKELVEVHQTMVVASEIRLEVAAGVPAESLGARGTEVLRIVGEALTNARRHARAPTVRVHAAGTGTTLVVEVVDDGEGFDPDEVAGSGIAGMRERATLLDGNLRVRSARGATSVLLEVPLVASRRQPGSTIRVLLVEDDTAMRDALAWTLGREPDLEVVAVAGSLGEARLALEGVDVAIIDLGLPDGFGGDLVADLLSVEPGAHAVVLSATVDPAEIERAYAHGAAGVLNKLAHLDQLVDTVRGAQSGAPLAAARLPWE